MDCFREGERGGAPANVACRSVFAGAAAVYKAVLKTYNLQINRVHSGRMGGEALFSCRVPTLCLGFLSGQ